MRQGLTLEQALRGEQPEPLTRAEWDAMHRAASEAPACRHWWSAWDVHGHGRVRHCVRCKLTHAEPLP